FLCPWISVCVFTGPLKLTKVPLGRPDRHPRGPKTDFGGPEHPNQFGAAGHPSLRAIPQRVSLFLPFLSRWATSGTSPLSFPPLSARAVARRRACSNRDRMPSPSLPPPPRHLRLSPCPPLSSPSPQQRQTSPSLALSPPQGSDMCPTRNPPARARVGARHRSPRPSRRHRLQIRLPYPSHSYANDTRSRAMCRDSADRA
ncbi:hypothetical protein K523DRAFT_380052, partial [Schizophyllum commune Tattone D]